MLQCQTCGGTYNATQLDGTEYYHACPPLSGAEIQTLIGKGLLVLRGDMAAQLATAEAADALLAPNDPARVNVARFLGTLTIQRPNSRNENIAPPAPGAKPGAIVSEGAGVVEVAAPGPAGPVATFQAPPAQPA